MPATAPGSSHRGKKQAAAWRRTEETPIHLRWGPAAPPDAPLALLKPPQFMKLVGNASVSPRALPSH